MNYSYEMISKLMAIMEATDCSDDSSVHFSTLNNGCDNLITVLGDVTFIWSKDQRKWIRYRFPSQNYQKT